VFFRYFCVFRGYVLKGKTTERTEKHRITLSRNPHHQASFGVMEHFIHPVLTYAAAIANSIFSGTKSTGDTF
jgi:hypothetical protein